MRECMLDTPRGRFAIVRHGQAGGAAAPLRVLALHGWLDNAASFAPLAAAFAADGGPALDFVALDFAGHGLSAHRPAGSFYHLVDNLDDVDAVLDALGWARCVLLGHSLGGAVASMYAAAAPARVDALLLVEALGPLPYRPGSAAAALADALAQRRRVGAKRLTVYPDIASAVAARMRANDLSEPVARLLVERGLAATEGGFVWRSDPRLTLATPLRAGERQILEWIEAIRAPTLVIGADPPSSVLSAAMRDARMAALRHGRGVLLAGGHHLHMEQPLPVAAALRQFLAQLRPGAVPPPAGA